MCGASLSRCYIPSTVVCADMFNDFVDRVFKRDISMSSLIGFECICVALIGLLTGLEVFLLFLTRTMNTGSIRTLWMRSSYSTVSQKYAADYTLVDGE